MPTDTFAEAPPAAPAGEIKLSQLGRANARTKVPDSVMAAARAASGETPSDPVKESPAVTQGAGAAGDAHNVSVPGATPGPASTPPAEPAKKSGIENLREAHEKLLSRMREMEAGDSTTKKSLAEATATAATFKSQIDKYEKEIAEDYKPRVQRLSEVEKALQDREEKLRVRDWTSSSEFHDKFVKPLAQVAKEAEDLMTELVVEEDGTPRQATTKDFEAVLAAPSLNEAARIARSKFGDDVYQSVVNMRSRIQSLQRSRRGEMEQAAARSEEWVKENQSKAAQSRQQLRDTLMSESQKLIEANPDIFKIGEDKELNEALNEGFRLADLSINGDPNLTPTQFMGVVAKARTGIAKASVLEKVNARLSKEVGELKGLLKAYQNSEPNVEPRNQGGAPAPVSSTKDEVRAAMLLAAQKVATGH